RLALIRTQAHDSPAPRVEGATAAYAHEPAERAPARGVEACGLVPHLHEGVAGHFLGVFAARRDGAREAVHTGDGDIVQPRQRLLVAAGDVLDERRERIAW